MKERANVKISKTNEAQWIYFKGRIQCFKCGWWNSESDNLPQNKAIELWKQHICEEEIADVNKEVGHA